MKGGDCLKEFPTNVRTKGFNEEIFQVLLGRSVICVLHA